MTAHTRTVVSIIDETIEELFWWSEMLKAMREERHRSFRANQRIYLPCHVRGDGERR